MSEQPHQEWRSAGEYTDIRYEKSYVDGEPEGVAKITINRPQVRNAFRPLTVKEMSAAVDQARDDGEVGAVILTGEGPLAFCSGGDQRIRGDAGYVGDDGVPRLNVLDLQRQIRTLPKPVVAMVAGYAIGGGHVLHMICDLTIAADNARFGQTGPRVGSFDGGYGASYMARIVGQKKAREIWFLCRQYDARQALDMGLVNTVVPLERLEEETLQWCREMLANSPDGAALPEGGDERRLRRSGGSPGTGGQRDAAVLHDAGGAGGAAGVPRETEARFLEVSALSMSRRGGLRAWVQASRPKTLWAAVTPVVVGTACAVSVTGFISRSRPGCPGRRDLDPDRHQPLERCPRLRPWRRHTSDASGPARAVQSGQLSRGQVWAGAWTSRSGSASACGLYLAAGGRLARPRWSARCRSLSGLLYTAGSLCVGVHGAWAICSSSSSSASWRCAGTVYVQALQVPVDGVVGPASQMGALTTAILVTNNLRDLDRGRSSPANGRWRCASAPGSRGSSMRRCCCSPTLRRCRWCLHLGLWPLLSWLALPLAL